jgi:hypothetical protein
MNTVFVWVLLATSIDPLKAECLHVRVAGVYGSEATCQRVETAERAPGAPGVDTVWNCEKMQVTQ